MNVRKLLARLNPGTMNLRGSGRGGQDLSSADISGALGFVEDGLGREVLCHLWWQLGARLTRSQLLREIALLQSLELSRLRRALRNASDRLTEAELRYYATRCRSAEDEREKRRATAERDQAREQCWSYDPQVYARIGVAVLNEMAGTQLCAACKGDGCPSCEHLGVVPVSALQRAAAIGVAETPYRKRWVKVYDFTYIRLREAERRAGNQLRAALRDDWEAAA
jgi:hypothetical protein